jgi:signal transduction histidine kinase
VETAISGVRRAVDWARSPLDFEERQGVVLLVWLRWLMAATSIYIVDYRPGTHDEEYATLNGLAFGVVGFNVLLHGWLLSRRPLGHGLPVLASAYDAAAVTAAMAMVLGFANATFLLYYPALLGFSVAFPGLLSLSYGAAVIAAYGFIGVNIGGNYNPDSVGDQKSMVLRVTTMAVTVIAANFAMNFERERRRRAVAAEAKRGEEVLALERRAVELERAAAAERERLMAEVHDGVAQSVYMLHLGLETAAEELAEEGGAPAGAARISALTGLARETLLETRGLLFDMREVMAGQTSLVKLATHQAQEFSAVTGKQASLTVRGQERTLAARSVGELYRVVQAALGNVHRHSGASDVEIGLAFEDPGLVLSITDNGRGFDLTVPPGGLGLETMRRRAEALGGTLAVRSAPGSGTALTFTIPWEAAGAADPHLAR